MKWSLNWIPLASWNIIEVSLAIYKKFEFHWLLNYDERKDNCIIHFLHPPFVVIYMSWIVYVWFLSFMGKHNEVNHTLSKFTGDAISKLHRWWPFINKNHRIDYVDIKPMENIHS